MAIPGRNFFTRSTTILRRLDKVALALAISCLCVAGCHRDAPTPVANVAGMAGDDSPAPANLDTDPLRVVTSPQGNAQIAAAKKISNAMFANDQPIPTEDFTDAMKANFTAEKVAGIRKAVRDKYGALKKLGEIRRGAITGFDFQYVTCLFEKGVIDTKVVFDQDQKISGFWIVKHDTN